MGERVEIFLLGGLLIRRNGAAVSTLVSRKAEALVVYLARQIHPLARERLASFLWDEHGQEQASGNLRVVLSSIRKELGATFEATRQFVEIRPSADLWVDANVLESKLNFLAKRTEPQLALPPEAVAALQQAVALYQGEFLAGFSLHTAEPFEEWARQERQRFQIWVQEGLDALVAHYLAVGQYTAGIEQAQRWLQIDPLNENALRQLLRLLGGNGQRNLAIHQFAAFQHRMIEELGVEPAPETLALYERLLETEINLRQPAVALPAPTVVDLRAPPPHNLPSPLLPIVGREHELRQIEERLLDSACRLLTLTGMGGIGKTRLAIEATQRLLKLPTARTLFADGLYFVRLEPINAGELLPSVIAEALNFQFQGKSEPSVQLLAYLRPKQLLLFMDNFEHLVEQSDLVLEILHQAPQIKVLATSRERLNFEGEWLIDVPGLPYLPPATHTAELLTTPAAQFFIRCATAVQPDFTPAQQRAAIAELCQQLDGSPLGLLLAAAAVRTHSCQQISAEIKRNQDFLAAHMRNLPVRHRTLRAVFAHSWALLSSPEQQALQRLAIFPDRFTDDAALHTAAVSPALLQSLVDKSLLQYGILTNANISATLARGYKFHRTLYPFVAEKLSAHPALVAELQDKHCAYFANFLATQAPVLKGAEAVQATALLALEWENVRASWLYAANQRQLAYLAESLEGFTQFYLLRGPLSEAQAALQVAINQIRTHFAEQLPAELQSRRLLGRLTAELARFCNERGLFAQALSAAQEALALSMPADHENRALAYQQWGAALHLQARYPEAQLPLEQSLQIAEAAHQASLCAGAHFLLGRTLMYQGNYPVGRRHAEQAVEIYQTLGERYSELNATNSLALVEFFSGDYSTAQAIYERCLIGYRAIADERSIGRTLNNLGAVWAQLGDYGQAQRWYQEGLALKRAIGDRPTAGLILANLSLMAYHTGEYQTALDYSHEALALSQELGERDTQAYARFCRGHALTGLGRLAEAAETYRQATELRRALGQQTQALDPLVALARLHLRVGDLAEAQKLVATILPSLQENTLAGIVELVRLYLTCYQVLHAQQDARAHNVLMSAGQILHARAAKISDPVARHSYLHNVAAHRELLAEYDLIAQ